MRKSSIEEGLVVSFPEGTERSIGSGEVYVEGSGVVDEVSEHGIWVKLVNHYPELDEWKNRLHFSEEGYRFKESHLYDAKDELIDHINHGRKCFEGLGHLTEFAIRASCAHGIPFASSSHTSRTYEKKLGRTWESFQKTVKECCDNTIYERHRLYESLIETYDNTKVRQKMEHAISNVKAYKEAIERSQVEVIREMCDQGFPIDVMKWFISEAGAYDAAYEDAHRGMWRAMPNV